ncbi:hypothetical protein ANCCAN_02832 [Ancylostoma caninum]|uniref:GATOR2 complex protein MIO zinc-ribbon like domain-containing protein n=1 Tax=Ancylostoma caninum TaxID=29170 RepID=A0A368H6Z9_ANCCA|nr:hypothetical protein ANCCAN_02832 [Ancylostoma caninum]
MVKADRVRYRSQTRKRSLKTSLGDDSDEDGSAEDVGVKLRLPEYHANYRFFNGIRYTVARHSDPGGCAAAADCVMQCHTGRCYSLGCGRTDQKKLRFFCPPKLFFPVMPQVRYVSERVVEVFTANAAGRIELHHIVHPNMPRHSIYKVESIDLTDGQPKHRITSRDFVDRTPFSVHGTFDGRIGVAKSACSLETSKVTALEIWRGKDPIMTTRVNQLDNGLLAATNFQCIPTTSSLFVLDLISQSEISLEPRNVFNAVTSSNMLDVCWLWDHPARLLLSTTDSIRLFDIRCPKHTDQALFLDHGITHMASNKYRTHIFAGYNDEEVHIYDSRRLFGPIQRVKIAIDSKNGLSSMKWNPYLPNELLLHFRDSRKILRCNVQEMAFDPFRRIVCDSFMPEDIFPIEQIWEGTISPDLIDARMKTYNQVVEPYKILTYGEMYDKCKDDPESPMPLCWTTPACGSIGTDKENDMMNLADIMLEEPTSLDRLRRASEFNVRTASMSQASDLRRVRSDTYLTHRIPGADLRLKSQRPARVPTQPVRSNSPVELLRARRFQLLATADGVDSAQTPVPDAPSEPQCGSHKSISYVGTDCSSLISNELEGRKRETDSVEEFGSIHEKHLTDLAFVFRHLGLDLSKTEALIELQKHAEIAMNDDMNDGSEVPYVVRAPPAGGGCSITGKKVDSGRRIKLQHKICSFDFAPVGYSGVLCLVEQPNGRSRLVFAPFIAYDEGFPVRPEFTKVLEETRVWESFDSIPYHLYQIMKLRLFNGMDRIDDQKPLLSIFHNLTAQIPTLWMQWLLSAARKQQGYNELRDVSDIDDAITDPDDFSGNEKSSVGSEECPNTPTLDVKGLPGILQLCTLESESDVSWHDCDSAHFTFIKIARSNVRRMMMAPYCLPVSQDRIVSDERFAASTDVLQQMPVIFLCLINGDTIRFIEYTLFIRRKLGKPVFTDNPCSFLNAFHFFSTIVSRYVNKISIADDKSSPKYVARRLRLVDKIHAFIKEHTGSLTLNPFFIPMLLIIRGELTSTHPEAFTKIVLESEGIPLGLRIAWCANLLPTCKMKEALHYLFQQSTGMERLQFVGLGRHPDALQVLSEYLYSTQDCQVVSHLLVAGRCFEEDDPGYQEKVVAKSVENVNLMVDDANNKEIGSIGTPSLYTMFPTSHLLVADEMQDLLHLAHAEFCRYSYILQRMGKYCFRRKMLSLVPQIYWPDFKTSVDISCTFCGSSYEAALRSAELAVTDQIVQVRARSSVSRATTNRSSASLSGTSIGPTMSLSLSSAAPSDSETSTNTAIAEPLSYDYNGVDGGTEAEIKRAPDSACPQCRKSYPRCCLCGLSYGTPVNDYDHPAGTFSMMFSTCLKHSIKIDSVSGDPLEFQMCSHGGHTKHIISWFEKEDVCPVLGCDCRCLHLENGVGGRIRQTIMTPF